MTFIEWLQKEKGMSLKSSQDTLSRLRRVSRIISIADINNSTISLLEKDENFKVLSKSVKSQLRRAIRLYIEFVK